MPLSQIIKANAVLPVSLAQMALQMETTAPKEGTDKAAQWEAMIVAAGDHAARHMGRDILTVERTLTLHYFPAGHIEIDRPQVREVTAVKYLNPGGEQQTLDKTGYHVSPLALADPNSLQPAKVYRPKPGWPRTYAGRDREDVVTVEFKAGFGDAPENIPGPVRQAILLIVGSLFINRGDNTDDFNLPNAAKVLLSSYRQVRI